MRLTHYYNNYALQEPQVLTDDEITLFKCDVIRPRSNWSFSNWFQEGGAHPWTEKANQPRLRNPRWQKSYKWARDDFAWPLPRPCKVKQGPSVEGVNPAHRDRQGPTRRRPASPHRQQSRPRRKLRLHGCWTNSLLQESLRPHRVQTSVARRRRKWWWLLRNHNQRRTGRVIFAEAIRLTTGEGTVRRIRTTWTSPHQIQLPIQFIFPNFQLDYV